MQTMLQLGGFKYIEEIFNLLLSKGPTRGYFPKPTKSILVVKPAMVERAKARFDHLGFQVTTGTRYLGDFVRVLAGQVIPHLSKSWRVGDRHHLTSHSGPILPPKPPSLPPNKSTSTSGSTYSA